MPLNQQIIWLFIMAIPIACVAWTITNEEIFKEPREYCINKSKVCKTLVQRKFFYLFTCEYCFSHYVTLFFVCLTNFKLLVNDWRGYVIATFALVWIANIYMSLFAFLRQGIKKEKTEITIMTKSVEEANKQKEIESIH